MKILNSTVPAIKITAITPKELEFLTAIDASEYGDSIMDEVWFFTIADNSSLSKASLGGITASLLEKGLITVKGEHTAHKKADQYEHGVGFTRDGVASYIAALGYDVSKARKWISEGLREALDDALAPTASTGAWLAYAGRVAAKASENEASKTSENEASKTSENEASKTSENEASAEAAPARFLARLAMSKP